jgi:hypothetical protein
MAYFVGAVFLGLALATCQLSHAKKVVGWAEKVCILPENVIVTAKIDTGADHSSIDVQAYHLFERDGVRWVRFDINNGQDQSVTFERKVVRMAKIKRHKGRHHERPVVNMTICMGGVKREADVNLIDRSRFTFRMLIGRSFLEGQFAVDPSATFTIEPVCQGDGNR